MSSSTNSSLVTITAIPSRVRPPLANRKPISDSARLVDRRSPKRFSTIETSVYILAHFRSNNRPRCIHHPTMYMMKHVATIEA